MNRMIWPSCLDEIVQHGFQTLFEFAAKFGAGDQRAHVERQQTLALHAFRHFAVDDALRQTFDDGGFTDAGFADQHRIVLGAALQYLNGAANFVVAADHRIELALFGTLGQIDGVFLQRLTLFLGVGIVHLLAAAHFSMDCLERTLGDTGLTQRVAEAPLSSRAASTNSSLEMYWSPRFCASLSVRFSSARGRWRSAHRRPRLPPAAASPGLAQLRAQLVDIDVGLGEQRPHGAALLIEQRDHHMQRLDELMVTAHRQTLRVGQGHLEFAGQFVHSHGARHSGNA